MFCVSACIPVHSVILYIQCLTRQHGINANIPPPSSSSLRCPPPPSATPSPPPSFAPPGADPLMIMIMARMAAIDLAVELTCQASLRTYPRGRSRPCRWAATSWHTGTQAKFYHISQLSDRTGRHSRGPRAYWYTVLRILGKCPPRINSIQGQHARDGRPALAAIPSLARISGFNLS